MPAHPFVEDNEDDAFLIQRAFYSLGLQLSIHHAQDGREAIAYLNSRPGKQEGGFPLLVILDLKMRQTSGFAVLEWMRARDLSNLMVIILTASTARADIEKAEAFNVEAYLVKPASLLDTKEMTRCICHLWLNQIPAPLQGSLFNVLSDSLSETAEIKR